MSENPIVMLKKKDVRQPVSQPDTTTNTLLGSHSLGDAEFIERDRVRFITRRRGVVFALQRKKMKFSHLPQDFRSPDYS